MNIDKAESILRDALLEAYPYSSSAGSFYDDYIEAEEALEYLIDLAKNNTANISDRVKDSKDSCIKEIIREPKFYVERIPYCKDCDTDTELMPTGINLLSNPMQIGYKCPKCNKEYYFREGEIGGYWEWQN